MVQAELIHSRARPDGQLVAVFEHDGSTGYFYLYEPSGLDGRRIVAAVRVVSGDGDLDDASIEIRWDDSGTIAGLLVRGEVRAAFDTRSGARYGGDDEGGARPVPARLRAALRWS